MMPTFFHWAHGPIVRTYSGPDAIALVVDRARAAEIAIALERLDYDDSRGRPAGYEYGRLELVAEIRAALDRTAG